MRTGRERFAHLAAVRFAKLAKRTFQMGDLSLGESFGSAAEQRSDEELHFCQIVGLEKPSAQAGATIGDSPGSRLGIALVIERQTGDIQFLPVLPNERPSAVTRDALTCAIDLRSTVHLGPCGDDQFTMMKNVFRHETDDRRLNRR